MNIYDQLKQQSTLSIVEKQVADFILSKGELILHMSIQDLAKQTFTSTTTIIRLCKKLGCSGFKEFKLQFSKDLRSSFTKHTNIDINSPFSQDDSENDIADKIATLTKETIMSCQSSLNMDNLYLAVKKF